MAGSQSARVLREDHGRVIIEFDKTSAPEATYYDTMERQISCIILLNKYILGNDEMRLLSGHFRRVELVVQPAEYIREAMQSWLKRFQVTMNNWTRIG